jgi:hypothetical protein
VTVNIDRCPGCGIMLDELRRLRARCAEVEARILADEERRKLTGDALYAERASEHEFNRANALERACVEKDQRIATQAEALAAVTAECAEQRDAKEAAYAKLYATEGGQIMVAAQRDKAWADIGELTRQRDELASFHEDEKTWRIGAEQERDDAKQRIAALEDDAEMAGAAMGAVCVLATLRPGEKYAGPTDHAAVYAVVSMLAQRDALAVAAKEYLMRSVPDPNTGRNAEDSLREILAHLDAVERDEP